MAPASAHLRTCTSIAATGPSGVSPSLDSAERAALAERGSSSLAPVSMCRPMAATTAGSGAGTSGHGSAARADATAETDSGVALERAMVH